MKRKHFDFPIKLMYKNLWISVINYPKLSFFYISNHEIYISWLEIYILRLEIYILCFKIQKELNWKWFVTELPDSINLYQLLCQHCKHSNYIYFLPVGEGSPNAAYFFRLLYIGMKTKAPDMTSERIRGPSIRRALTSTMQQRRIQKRTSRMA